MDSLIRETNDNLKVIIDTLKVNLDTSISTLDNIQVQMDKKVEEAKKYKIQVDDAKDKIKTLEEDNKSLELSLKELNDKYGKMNLVSLVEAGNREIKTKINDNNREINKQKEHIADLTNRARTIKDLLINLKKDRTIKEERLENIKVVYEYYSNRINDIMDFAFNHSENLLDYQNNYNFDENYEEEVVNSELENTMVFDEIANIDENKNFKDEMSFIDEQIENALNNSEKIYDIDEDKKFDIEEVKVNEDELDSTQVFDSILDTNFEELEKEEVEEKESNEFVINNNDLFISNEDSDIQELDSNTDINNEEDISKEIDINLENENSNDFNLFIDDEESKKEVSNENIEDIKDESKFKTINNLDIFNIRDNNEETLEEIDDSEDRISKINDLFSSIDNTKTSNIPLSNGIEKEIDNAYMDVFGKPLEEKDLNKTTTLTDIFGNPIKKEELSEEIKIGKKLEELFIENGIDFNKFKEDEQNYLKQIYNEEKFTKILDTLKKNKINLDNLYNSFNIFGELSDIDLDEIISKLINSGQSVEAVGLVLEKLPKVKKYNLDDAIISYGEYIKDIDITELIMKAKELYDGGNK